MKLMSLKEINNVVSGVRTSMANVRDKTHIVLCHVAGHAYEHGDVTGFDVLFDALSGANRKKVCKWVSSNGFATLKKDGKFQLNKSARKDADFEDGAEVAEYLLAQSKWFEDEETGEQIARQFDEMRRFESFLKQMEEAKQEGRLSAALDNERLKMIDRYVHLMSADQSVAEVISASRAIPKTKAA